MDSFARHLLLYLLLAEYAQLFRPLLVHLPNLGKEAADIGKAVTLIDLFFNEALFSKVGKHLCLLFILLFLESPEPGVCKHLLRSRPQSRVPGEQLLHEIFRLVADVPPLVVTEVTVTILNLFGQLANSLRIKGHDAGQKRIGHDANAPVITLVTIDLLADDFGRAVLERPDQCNAQPVFDRLVVRNGAGRSEVDEFDGAEATRRVRHDQILEANVSVQHLLPVNVLNCQDKVVNTFCRLFFLESILADQVMKQV